MAALGVFALVQTLHFVPLLDAAAKCALLAGFPLLLWALGVLSHDEIATLDSLRRSVIGGQALVRRRAGQRGLKGGLFQETGQ